MSSIDTKKCPVYMLTGEYDWSNTPAMGQATCDKINGGKHQAMKGVGHFPATENPKVFVGYRKYHQSYCCEGRSILRNQARC
jgi:pimeloyl-ACP methyl ester carboxylesterase